MELLWRNGQVVMQSQNQRSVHKNCKYDAVIPDHTRTPASQPQPQPENQNPQLFMHEDEMASWLQYPLGDDDPFCADLLYSDSATVQSNNTTANPPTISAPPSRPPIHPLPRRTELQNFLHFSRNNNNNNNKPRIESAAPSGSKSVVRESTTVDSSDTPLVAPSSRVMDSRPDASNTGMSMSGGGRALASTTTTSFDATAAASAGKEAMTCEMSLTSSPGGSSASGSASAEQTWLQKPPPAEDRKRKGREAADDAECPSEVSWLLINIRVLTLF